MSETNAERAVALTMLYDEASLNLAKAEFELEKAKSVFTELTEKTIPGFLESLGMSELTLSNGRKISVKPEIYSSIKEGAKVLAGKWLTDKGYGPIVRHTFISSFGVNEQDKANEVRKKLEVAKVDFTEDIKIHPQTLAATIRTILGNGEEVPDELFNVSRKTKAKVSVLK